MVPLQAKFRLANPSVPMTQRSDGEGHTELLLDNLENLLLVEFLGETLDSGQSLTTIALCMWERQLACAPFYIADEGRL